MAKGFFGSVKSFSKNLLAHAKLLMSRQESLGDAMRDIRRDSKKLKATVVEIDLTSPHAKAVQMVKNGRIKYNNHDYETAEKCFRGALLEDPDYTLALTYLGHALYKLGRATDAAVFWKRAVVKDPDSPAGQKAKEKLEHLENRTANLVSSLEERIN
jgi:tetratricopeptide (TPR) repeat protein